MDDRILVLLPRKRFPEIHHVGHGFAACAIDVIADDERVLGKQRVIGVIVSLGHVGPVPTVYVQNIERFAVKEFNHIREYAACPGFLLRNHLRAASLEIGDISVEKIGGTTALGADGAPEVILLIKYVGTTLAGGVLVAIGADIWKKIKKFTTNTFKKYREKFNPEDQWFYNPIIVSNCSYIYCGISSSHICCCSTIVAFSW